MSGAAIISIHDVAPDTLSACEQLRDVVQTAMDDAPVSLLVVPNYHGDGSWPDRAAARLRELQSVGDEVVLHGWEHRDATGRDGAEFFRSMTVATAADLLRRGRCLLQGLGLPATGFIAPAYAHPPCLHRALADAGFDWWATRGVLHIGARHQQCLPSVGLGASTPLKRRLSPSVARAAAVLYRRAPVIRLDLHPADLQHPRLGRAVGLLVERVFGSGREPVRHVDVARWIMEYRATGSAGDGTWRRWFD
ncbi:MAG: DUF2334 domain-containing protein [Thermoleophilia bacterium]